MENLREQRGLVIAATTKIRRYGDKWKVPSQTGNGFYVVDSEHHECSCPDYETRRQDCKHIFAAIFTLKRELGENGSITVTETLTLSRTSTQRPTYPQVWPAYNEAQTNEKDKFRSLLADLCKELPKLKAAKTGRPSLPLCDAVFSAVFKVYSTVSARRFMTDLRDATSKGFIAKTPHFNSVLNCLESPEITPILRWMVTQSSLPLQSVETEFAVDSSGFTTSRFVRWFDVKYGAYKAKQEWVKCHIMCGVKTNIITAVEIGDKHASDLKFFPPMVEATARNFRIAEVSADAAYGGRATTDVVHAVGGTPFIAFRHNATGGVGGTYKQMFHYFMFRRDEFLAHYHRRSNVESTFSMMKRKFGDSLRSKTDVAMVNETLCKILCHNLVVLIHEMCELGIDPVFWPKLA